MHEVHEKKRDSKGEEKKRIIGILMTARQQFFTIIAIRESNCLHTLPIINATYVLVLSCMMFVNA